MPQAFWFRSRGGRKNVSAGFSRAQPLIFLIFWKRLGFAHNQLMACRSSALPPETKGNGSETSTCVSLV